MHQVHQGSMLQSGQYIVALTGDSTMTVHDNGNLPRATGCLLMFFYEDITVFNTSCCHCASMHHPEWLGGCATLRECDSHL